MSSDEKNSVLARFSRQLDSGRVSDDTSITFCIEGGAPGTRLSELVVMDSRGSTRVKLEDTMKQKHADVASARDELGQKAFLSLAGTVARAIGHLTPRSKARFVPDSLVGSVTLGLGNDAETYFFDADEEALKHRGEKLSPPVEQLLKAFESIQKRCLNAASSKPEGEQH